MEKNTIILIVLGIYLNQIIIVIKKKIIIIGSIVVVTIVAIIAIILLLIKKDNKVTISFDTNGGQHESTIKIDKGTSTIYKAINSTLQPELM